MDISYSDGSTIKNVVIQIWDDWHTERAGFYRAFWCADKDGYTGSPVIGYCSPGGTYRTIRAAVAEALRLYPGEQVFRNGKRIA